MWYKTWCEMLQGVQLVMSHVERHGDEVDLVVGVSFQLSSGSTMGSELLGCVVQAGGLLGFHIGLGRMSWMQTWGAVVGIMAWMRDGLASTLSGAVVGGLIGWQVDGLLVGWSTRLAHWMVCWWATLSGKKGGGLPGLQFLATTVASSSSSLARMLKELLLPVWRWCTSGMFLMRTLGALMM